MCDTCEHGTLRSAIGECLFCFISATVVIATVAMAATPHFNWFGKNDTDRCKARNCGERRQGNDRYCGPHRRDNDRLNSELARANYELQSGKLTPNEYDRVSRDIMNDLLNIFGQDGR